MTRTNAIQRNESNACCSQPAAAAPTQATAARREPWTYRPNADILELDSEFVVHAEIPGVNRGELDVTLEKSVLTISGRVPQRIPGAARTLVQEYGVGDYQRQFNFGRLAEQVNREAITAEYANGLLTVHLPKTAAAKPTKVNVALRS